MHQLGGAEGAAGAEGDGLQGASGLPKAAAGAQQQHHQQQPRSRKELSLAVVLERARARLEDARAGGGDVAVRAGVAAAVPFVRRQPADAAVDEGATVQFSITAGVSGLNCRLWVCWLMKGLRCAMSCLDWLVLPQTSTTTHNPTQNDQGGEPLTYRWCKDGRRLRIATADTADLILVSVTGADAGQYHCEVTNDDGEATSGRAVLTVRRVSRLQRVTAVGGRVTAGDEGEEEVPPVGALGRRTTVPRTLVRGGATSGSGGGGSGLPYNPRAGLQLLGRREGAAAGGEGGGGGGGGSSPLRFGRVRAAAGGVGSRVGSPASPLLQDAQGMSSSSPVQRPGSAAAAAEGSGGGGNAEASAPGAGWPEAPEHMEAAPLLTPEVAPEGNEAAQPAAAAAAAASAVTDDDRQQEQAVHPLSRSSSSAAAGGSGGRRPRVSDVV